MNSERYVTRFKENEKFEREQPTAAFIHFRSMEGAQRALEALKPSFASSLGFSRQPVKVAPAPNPDEVLWENVTLAASERRSGDAVLRTALVPLWLLCLVVVYLLQSTRKQAETEIQSQIFCPVAVSPLLANIDLSKHPSERVGDFNCYCRHLFSKGGP